MIRSSVRSAGLALLLTMNGCGGIVSSGTGARTPGLNVAEAALEGGAGQIALQVSDGVLAESPNNTRAMEIKGDALTLLGNYDDAAAIYQALLAKDPNSMRANIGLGRIRLSKDPAGAEALFQQVLKRDPKDMTALNNLGIARDLQGRHADAQTAYRQALAVNPDLESAQVNLALSMAMTGQGPAAVQLLKAKASRPDAPVKVKHDYAVVLAMAGNRPEAERLLSDDLAPDQVRQMLDGVTGTHTRALRDVPADASREALAAQRRDDDVPPDVVQVPEAAAAPPAPHQTSAIPAPPTTGATSAAVAAALSTPPPMIVRPRPVAEPESDTPVRQPVNPVAAAVTNQQSLSLPIQSSQTDPAPVAQAPVAAATPIVVPDGVAMPPARSVQRLASARDTVADAGPMASPEAPSLSPALATVPLPPADQPRPAAASVEPPARQVTTAATAPRAEGIPSSAGPATGPAVQSSPSAPPAPATTVVALAPGVTEATPKPAPDAAVATASDDATAATPAQTASQDASSPMVQFAAAPSEEAAHSFWQVLVHRFPDALGQREPVVIRFEHAGTVFWRVRTEGFATLSDAQTLCARMHAGGQDCFVPRS